MAKHLNVYLFNQTEGKTLMGLLHVIRCLTHLLLFYQHMFQTKKRKNSNNLAFNGALLFALPFL